MIELDVGNNEKLYVDDSGYSNKIKITLDKYNKLIDRYNDLSQRWNAIYFNKDDKSPINYYGRYGDLIPQNYRNKNKLYIKDSDIDKKFNTGNDNTYAEYKFDVTQGFYEIIMSGAGSGGLACVSTINSNDQTPLYPQITTSIAGSGGAVCHFIMYAPKDGEVKIIVGSGGYGLKNIFETNKYTQWVYSYPGGDTLIYFNDELVCKCEGGKASKVQYLAYRTYYSYPYSSDPNTYVYGKYVKDIIFSSSGVVGEKGGQNDTSTHKGQYINSEYQYGKGGDVSFDNALSPNIENGEDGYVSVKQYKEENYRNYIYGSIGLQSIENHTLGNENIIRDKFDEVLSKSYDGILDITNEFNEEKCYKIGEETEEIVDENKLLKYKDIFKNDDGSYKEIDVIDNANKISYVHQKCDTGCFPKDDYIITYDNDKKKRKLKITKPSVFDVNETESDIYYMFKTDENVSDDEKIIYLKEIEKTEKEGLNIDVWIYKNNKLEHQSEKAKSKKRYTYSNSTRTGIIKIPSNEIKTEGYLTFTLVSGGGGAGGTSNHKRWKNPGGPGGSGGCFSAIYRIKNNIIGKEIIVKAGNGGISGIGYKQSGSIGDTGGESYLVIKDNSIEIGYIDDNKVYINNELIGTYNSENRKIIKDSKEIGYITEYNEIYIKNNEDNIYKLIGFYNLENKKIIKSNNIINVSGGTGGSGGGKNGGNWGLGGAGGKVEEYIDDNNYVKLHKIISNINGNGIRDEKNGVYIVVDDVHGTVYRTGNPSVYRGTNYGAGAPALEPDYGGEGSRSLPGENGYAELIFSEDLRIIWKNRIYKQYDGYDPNTGVILYGHYKYLENRLDALENYLSVGKDWFDANGYCKRNCQIKYQHK